MLNMDKVIFCDPDKCTGCQICEVVCSAVKEKKVNPVLSRIHLVRIDPLFMTAVGCLRCNESPCVRSCPRNAIYANENGIIKIDEDKCNFCGWCIQSCPFGAITFTSSRAMLCDMCDGDPKCVEYCPKGALTFETREQVAHHVRTKTIKSLLFKSKP